MPMKRWTQSRPVPGTKAWDLYEAELLHSQLRAKVTDFAYTLRELGDLLRKAREGQIYVTLGYTSWTSYISDLFADFDLRLPVAARRELVALMDESEMSQRAIAVAVGVSKKTIQNDLEAIAPTPPQVDTSYPPDNPAMGTVGPSPDVAPKRDTVTGLDGKVHPKRKPAPECNDATEAATPPPKAEIAVPLGAMLDAVRTARAEICRISTLLRERLVTVGDTPSGLPEGALPIGSLTTGARTSAVSVLLRLDDALAGLDQWETGLSAQLGLVTRPASLSRPDGATDG